MEETGITVHTRKNAQGVTEVLGIDDDDDEREQSGKDAYETVTIVPSEGGRGETSYVLIVQEPEEKEDDDLKVFDFDEAEDPNADVSRHTSNIQFKI